MLELADPATGCCLRPTVGLRFVRCRVPERARGPAVLVVHSQYLSLHQVRSRRGRGVDIAVFECENGSGALLFGLCGESADLCSPPALVKVFATSPSKITSPPGTSYRSSGAVAADDIALVAEERPLEAALAPDEAALEAVDIASLASSLLHAAMPPPVMATAAITAPTRVAAGPTGCR